jgi:hypothetical protein
MSQWQTYLKFREGFKSILDRRFYTIDWLDDQIASGKIRIWAGDDAAILATLKEYPTGALELEGLAAVGDMKTIVDDLIPKAEAWGRERDCVTATISSREAWGRVMRLFGYLPYQTTIRKGL